MTGAGQTRAGFFIFRTEGISAETQRIAENRGG